MHFGQADGLPRLIFKQGKLEDEFVIAVLQTDFDFSGITQNMPLTHKTLRSKTGNDEIIRAAITYTSSSCPDIKQLRKLPTWLELELCYRSRNVLNVEQGCLMFADRVTVPRTVRLKILKAFAPRSSRNYA
ncbi:unnamed protein product [Toxocara canis]|uniref:Uncharacterized protein n=1 Tax=Toxocara canis TaxID=6265 RepID=A0A183UCI4_TOXCA|nr:unnamed protein product [Toxocara canis]